MKKGLAATLAVVMLMLSLGSFGGFAEGAASSFIASFETAELYDANKECLDTSGGGNKANNISYDSENSAVKASETRWRKNIDFSMDFPGVPEGGAGYIKILWKYSELNNVYDTTPVSIWITNKSNWSYEQISLGTVGELKSGWNVTEVKSEMLSSYTGAFQFTLSFVEGNPQTCCSSVLVKYVGFFASEQDRSEYGTTHKLMKSFSLFGADGSFDDEHNITVNVPYTIKKSDLKDAVPVIEIADGCTIYPGADAPQDFRDPVVYTVTRGEEMEIYTVNVILDTSAEENFYEIKFDTQDAYDKYNIYCRDGDVVVETGWDSETKSLKSYLFWRRNVNVEIQNLDLNADKYKYMALQYKVIDGSWTKNSTTQIGVNGITQTLFRNMPVRQETWHREVYEIDRDALTTWNGKVNALSWRPYCDPAEKVAGYVYLKYISFFETAQAAEEYNKFYDFYPINTDSVENATINYKYTFEKVGYAEYGDKVEFEVIPNSGYTVLSVKANGESIEPKDGIYSYIMPEESVDITVLTAGETLVSEIFNQISSASDVAEAESVELSYPEFFDALRSLKYYGKIKDSGPDAKNCFYNSLIAASENIDLDNLRSELNGSAWFALFKNASSNDAAAMFDEYAESNNGEKAYNTYLSCISESGRGEFCQKVLSNNYLNYSDYKNKIQLDAASFALEYAAGYERIKEIYSINRAKIGYTDDEWETLMRNANINSALAAVGGKSISAWSDAKSNLDAALKNAEASSQKPDEKPRPSGGGGGGGGTTVKYGENPVPQDDVITGSGFNVGEVENGEVVFSDTADLKWAEESIKNLFKRKIISGYGDGTFKPLNNVTREEFLKMAMLAFEIETKAGAECKFKDVLNSEWYYKYISSAAAYGIISGVEPDLFGTGNGITREQAVVILKRMEKYKDSLQKEAKEEENAEDAESGEDAAKTETKALTAENNDGTDAIRFADEEEISGYALEAVKQYAKRGIIKGFDDKTVKPQGIITRVEAAVILDRILKLQEVK